MDEPSSPPDILALTSRIVAAFVRKNTVPTADLPALIERTHKALAGLAVPAEEQAAPAPTPAVPVKRSVFPDYIVCLEDGKKLKMLKRHLMTAYGMTPDQYREKWRLSADYPMVAPNYAEHRSALAKTIGLGRKPELVPAATGRAGKGGKRSTAASETPA